MGKCCYVLVFAPAADSGIRVSLFLNVTARFVTVAPTFGARRLFQTEATPAPAACAAVLPDPVSREPVLEQPAEAT